MAEVSQNPTTQKGASNRQHKKSTRIDMTAMVDVAFLLLTFFILTTSLATPHALQLIKPIETKGQPIQCSKMLEIYPGESGRVHWYAGCDRSTITTTDFSEQGIRSIIRTHLTADPELVITLKPTPTSTFSSMVDVLDEMKITGATRYALAELAPEDNEMLDSRNLR